MNRAWGIVAITLTWCAIAAYLVAAGSYSHRKRGEVTVKDVRIVVLDTSSLKVVNHAAVFKWLGGEELTAVGTPIAKVDTRGIEKLLKTRVEVKSVHAWVNLDGVLTIEVGQRKPILRVCSSNGYRFWVTQDNNIIPDRGEFTAYVPIVTGYIPFPFPVAAKGSYDDMLDAAYNDLLEQFTNIENQRRSLVAQRSAVSSQISRTRAKRTKQFWSKARKEAFAVNKKQEIATLRQQIVKLDESLVALSAGKKTLRDKEKKSQQSYHFLTKLVNFVKYVENDDFWASYIVQINVTKGSQSGDRWREPRIELTPRAGDHIVMFGELDGRQEEKLDKLRLFYRNAVSHEGWEKLRIININYQGQIICTKR